MSGFHTMIFLWGGDNQCEWDSDGVHGVRAIREGLGAYMEIQNLEDPLAQIFYKRQKYSTLWKSTDKLFQCHSLPDDYIKCPPCTLNAHHILYQNMSSKYMYYGHNAFTISMT